jgi:glycosyltransferase involved in cell wall biosynthesis
LTAITYIVLRHLLQIVNIQYQAAAYHMRHPAINFLPWRLKGVTKTAVTFHDLRTPYLFPKAGRLRDTAVQFMARQAHGVIVTNPEDFQALSTNRHPSMCQIPIGSNITTYLPSPLEIAKIRDRFGLIPSDHLLGYFGFLHESKGADTLVAALSQLDARTHLVFIGGQQGSSDSMNNQAFLAKLNNQIHELGLSARVHWTGFVSDQEVSTYLHAADLMVMPYRDGVSLRRGTLMAILAHGRPLITTAPTVPTPELKHGEQAWFVPPDDSAALAEAIRQVRADKSLLKKLGDKAAQTGELFTWSKIASQTIKFFETRLDY